MAELPSVFSRVRSESGARLLAAVQQNRSEALGDGRERDVVGGHPELVAHGVDGVAGNAHRLVPPPGGDRAGR